PCQVQVVDPCEVLQRGSAAGVAQDVERQPRTHGEQHHPAEEAAPFDLLRHEEGDEGRGDAAEQDQHGHRGPHHIAGMVTDRAQAGEETCPATERGEIEPRHACSLRSWSSRCNRPRAATVSSRRWVAAVSPAPTLMPTSRAPSRAKTDSSVTSSPRYSQASAALARARASIASPFEVCTTENSTTSLPGVTVTSGR